MNAIPPSFASAIPKLSPDTDCMTALIIGIFKEIAGSSPFLKRTSGVFSETLVGIFSGPVNPGTSKYSLKVCEGSS